MRVDVGAFPALRAGNRAFRYNLFYRFAVKKDFRCNPWRAPSGSAKSHTRFCQSLYAGISRNLKYRY
jgi:hypothetical protein